MRWTEKKQNSKHRKSKNEMRKLDGSNKKRERSKAIASEVEACVCRRDCKESEGEKNKMNERIGCKDADHIWHCLTSSQKKYIWQKHIASSLCMRHIIFFQLWFFRSDFPKAFTFFHSIFLVYLPSDYELIWVQILMGLMLSSGLSPYFSI